MTDQSTTDPFNLQRFLDAQAGIGFTPYETALAEMRAGHKQSHWIWYVFPQIQLGTSALSEHFAIKSHDEAKAYLTNETLRSRYLEIAKADPLRVHVLDATRDAVQVAAAASAALDALIGRGT